MTISSHAQCAKASIELGPSLVSGRSPVIDGLRGLAVLQVIIFHFAIIGCKLELGAALWEQIYWHVAGIGWAGVDLFFVISGFLITGILFESRNGARYYRTFYLRRTIRIFPLYYMSLAFAFGIAPFVLRLMNSKEDVIRELIQPSTQAFAWLYLLNWRIGLGGWSGVSVYLRHFWSLSIEEQFYLGWPFIVRTLERRRLMAVCSLMILMSLGLRLTFFLLGMPLAAFCVTFCRLDSLAIGGIVALAMRDIRDWAIIRKVAPFSTALALIGLIVLLGVTRDVSYDKVWMGTIGLSLWGIFFGSLLVLALEAKTKDVLYRTSSWPFLRFLGKYSYCLYICHQPLIEALAHFGVQSDHLARILKSRLLAILAVNGIGFSLAILIALLSWHLFEKQLLKLKELPALQYITAHKRSAEVAVTVN